MNIFSESAKRFYHVCQCLNFIVEEFSVELASDLLLILVKLFHDSLMLRLILELEVADDALQFFELLLELFIFLLHQFYHTGVLGGNLGDEVSALILHELNERLAVDVAALLLDFPDAVGGLRLSLSSDQLQLMQLLLKLVDAAILTKLLALVALHGELDMLYLLLDIVLVHLEVVVEQLERLHDCFGVHWHAAAA